MIFLLLIGGPIVQDVLVLFQGCTEFMTHAAFYNASNVPLSNVLILRVVKGHALVIALEPGGF